MNKFFKSIFSFLERIGILKPSSVNIDTSEEIINYDTEVPKEQKEIAEEQYHLEPKHKKISDYKKGDIIIAKRYDSETEKKEIPLGHREGPYVVVDILPDELVCLYATGVPPKDTSFRYRTLLLEVLTYPDILFKDTYVHIAQERIINNDAIHFYIGHINKKDQKELNKKIEIARNENLYAIYDVPYNHIELEPGDIIEDKDSLLVIIGINNGLYDCLPLEESDKVNTISISGKRYLPLFNKLLKLPNLKNYNRIDVIPSTLLKSLNARYSNYLEFIGHYGEIMRGSVITFQNRYFYVNGELGDTFNGFEIFKEHKNTQHAKIMIGSEVFSTDFNNTIQFLKKDHEYTFYTNATTEEMNEIKEIKKSYIKKHRPKKPTPSKKRRAEIRKNNEYRANVMSGAIVTDIIGKNRYIVISRQDRNIIVMNMKNYEEFNYQLEVKNVDEVIYEQLFHPITFKKLLEELQNNPEVIKGYISLKNLKLLIN